MQLARTNVMVDIEKESNKERGWQYSKMKRVLSYLKWAACYIYERLCAYRATKHCGPLGFTPTPSPVPVLGKLGLSRYVCFSGLLKAGCRS